METPLREPTFLILTALAGDPLHGYGLIAEVDRLSDGRITLRPGTLYGALDRLTDAGLVAVDREETVDGRLRRYYRLSDQGTTVLAEETERMRRNVEAATARLRARPSPAPHLARLASPRTARLASPLIARLASPRTARLASPRTARLASPLTGRLDGGMA
ncbi:DNA-binding PadR family transcriptional regulator [Actinoplanes octamycinicus]|uniref:DNA-binding PadR family transcriptional regulator n=1 Tax=Actinoplanes octamycinicus TaxID=135948 RepID=A0A7W7H721_9ACTN|nr:DNA-binding PadR family transcriptional regulator [Actinoplanes octamycinicus]GIE55589.1 hypothetical protein Aoc01nite_09910 [Actinoplanes octamycinicus]